MNVLRFYEYCDIYYEGLIKTYPLTNCEKMIKDKLNSLNINYTLEPFTDNVDKFELIIIMNNEINISMIKQIADSISNLYGYFPSCFYSKNKIGERLFKWTELNDSTVNVNTLDVRIRFESKYSAKVINDCPNVLYHLTKKANLDKILKYGLCPKTKNRTTEHPGRIYLFSDYTHKQNLLNGLRFSDTKFTEYITLEIDCSENKLKLYSDPNYTLGYFTYDNINPKYITIKIS